MTLLEQIKILTSETNEQLLTLLIDKTKIELETIIGSNYVTEWDNLCSDIVVVKYNRRYNEGLSSISSSGMQESYINGYPKSIVDQINRFRKNVRFL